MVQVQYGTGSVMNRGMLEDTYAMHVLWGTTVLGTNKSRVKQLLVTASVSRYSHCVLQELCGAGVPSKNAFTNISSLIQRVIFVKSLLEKLKFR